MVEKVHTNTRFITDFDSMENIMVMARLYAEESGLDFTFSELRARETIEDAVRGDDAMVIGLETPSGVLVGLSLVVFSRLFSEETMANILMFYIVPKYRSYINCSKLLKATTDFVRPIDGYVLTNSVSLISDRVTAAYGAILKRRGFTELSPTYIKKGGW